jgi:hypothetical protein
MPKSSGLGVLSPLESEKEGSVMQPPESGLDFPAFSDQSAAVRISAKLKNDLSSDQVGESSPRCPLLREPMISSIVSEIALKHSGR